MRQTDQMIKKQSLEGEQMLQRLKYADHAKTTFQAGGKRNCIVL